MSSSVARRRSSTRRAPSHSPMQDVEESKELPATTKKKEPADVAMPPSDALPASRQVDAGSPSPDAASAAAFDLSSVVAAAASASPPPPAAAAAATVIDADEVVAAEGNFGSESKYDRLHHLLDKTSLFSQFLSERMPARFTAINKQQAAATAVNDGSTASSTKKRDHLAERAASLKALLPAKTDLALHSFQVSGVDWLISLYENGLNGILADEMGLGKSMQVIFFLGHLRAHRVFGPFLIVAPLGTLPAWRDETKRWTPNTPVLVYHGDKATRANLRKQFLSATIDETFPVVVTSFEIAMADAAFLKRMHWKLLTVDEGHRLKNMESLLLQKLKSFPSENRLLLTGTPLQNSLPELWSLLHFLLPDVFASLSQFQSWFDFDDQNLEAAEGQQYVINAERDHLLVSKLHSILRPFVLRRVKSEVLKHLAEKKEYVLYVPMTSMQRLYYQSILDGSMRRLASNSTSLNVRNVLMQLRKIVNHPYLLLGDQDEARLGIDMEERANNPLAASSIADAFAEDATPTYDEATLAKLRKHLSKRAFVASDNSDGEEDEEEEEKEDELDDSDDAEEDDDDGDGEGEYKQRSSAAAADTGFETITQRNKRRKSDQIVAAKASARRARSLPAARTLSFDSDPHRLTRVCGKLQLLDQLLPALRQRGSRVLIFSQMTRILDILEDFLVLQGAPKKFKYCRIDGTTSSADRARQIAAFNEDDSYFVFLLSTRAGGLGLNLAQADTVILYDTDYNPTADAQAADRAHRLTQQRQVVVFRLLTPGSVEVGIFERASSKKKLEQLVLAKGKFNQRAIETNGGETAAVVNWRQQQSIVTELVELFQMKPATHAAIRTHLDAGAATASTAATPVAATVPPTAASSSVPSPSPSPPVGARRTSLKRKSSTLSTTAASSSSSSKTSIKKPFDSAWIDRLLQRDEEPPADILPRSSYESGFVYIANATDPAGLLSMLTEKTSAAAAAADSTAAGACAPT